MTPGCSKAQWLLILAMRQFFTQAHMKFPHFEEKKNNSCARCYPTLSFSPTFHAQCLQNDSGNTTLECRYRAAKGTFYNSYLRIQTSDVCVRYDISSLPLSLPSFLPSEFD